MAPKRARASQSAAGPSHDTSDQYLREMNGREVWPEREFQATSATVFWEQLMAQHIVSMATRKGDRIDSLVREFYARAKEQRTLTPRVRGYTIHGLTEGGVRAVYHLSPLPACTFRDINENLERYPWDDVLHTIALPGAQWTRPNDGQSRIPRAGMRAAAKNWLHFIGSNVAPSKHKSDVNTRTALLMYLLMTGQPVRLELVILETIRQAVFQGRSNAILPFPHLITDLCLRAGIPDSPSETKIRMGMPYKYRKDSEDLPPAYEQRAEEEMLEEAAVQGEDVPEPSQGPQEHGPSATQVPTPDMAFLASELLRLRTDFDEHRRDFGRTMNRVQRYQRAIARHLQIDLPGSDEEQ